MTCPRPHGRVWIMNENVVPTRTEYMRERGAQEGRKVAGVFPSYVPKEILWAADFLPVEIWDPPLETSEANAHMQPYICSVVKLGLELILQGRADSLDAFVFPHTCDSLQNMASVVHDYMGRPQRCHFFYHPKAPYTEASKVFLRSQLETLAGGLLQEEHGMSEERLGPWVEKGREVQDALRRLYRLRAEGALKTTNAQFYETVRLGEYLLPDDYLSRLSALEEAVQNTPGETPTILLSGILPCPRGVLASLDELGVRVGGDDLLACGRRLGVRVPEAKDPFSALVESYFAMPPCSTRGSSIRERLDHLLDLAERCQAKGVLFLVIKFCEPELFDVPQLVEGLKKEGLSALVLECEANESVSGQMSTRIEAFVETIT